MSLPRWTLSIRAAVLLAIALGVFVPALGLLLVDARWSRQEHEPLVQRSRDAVLAIAVRAVTEPVWLIDQAALLRTVQTVLAESNVCGVEVLERRPNAEPVKLQRCAPDVRVVERVAPMINEGQRLGEIRIRFNDNEIDQLLAERRVNVLWLTLAQAAAGALVLLLVLYWRLLRPIGRLKAQASAIASRSVAEALNWDRRDELGEFGAHLNSVREQIDALFGELEAKNAELRKLAMHDQLTGLPNRAMFNELFLREAAIAQREQRKMALLFLDLDRFKSVNDSLGHAAGDRLLCETSARLLASLRQSDLVCRQSGDEFLVLLRDADPWEHVAGAAARLLVAVQSPVALGDSASEVVQIGASIGVALFPQDGADFETLLRHADMAMYQSKAQGRSRYSFFHPELNAELRMRLGAEQELAHAIANDELLLHYQPIFHAQSLALASCEALVRWQHPQRGLLPPSEFIGLAEESGLIRELGAWTVREACRQIAQWRAQGLQPCKVAVNVSALQFRDQQLFETIQAALRSHRVDASELELELTESTLMADSDTSQRIIERLRELGLALVVDDFGTGFSSLSYLKRLRPDKIKIDRSFVRDLPDDADDRTVAEAILRMAQALGIRVVAEGVETTQQRDFLRAQGCELLQGYLLGRPEAAEIVAGRMLRVAA